MKSFPLTPKSAIKPGNVVDVVFDMCPSNMLSWNEPAKDPMRSSEDEGEGDGGEVAWPAVAEGVRKSALRAFGEGEGDTDDRIGSF